MTTGRISSLFCVVAAFAIGACAGDSQPTGPGGALYRGTSPAGPNPVPTHEPSGSGPEAPTATEPPREGQPPIVEERVRPIEEFLRAQGTFCVADEFGGCRLYSEPTANYLAWYDTQMGSSGTSVAVDYAGIADMWMQQKFGRAVGTDLKGRVTERMMPDGRVEVTVELFGQNVMGYAVDQANLNGPLAWGHRPMDLTDNNVAPATGNLTMTIRFVNHALGAPLPDLVQLVRAPEERRHLLGVWMQYDGQGDLGLVYGKPGEQGRLSVTYDGMRAPIEMAHPYDPANTPPMGASSITVTPDQQRAES